MSITGHPLADLLPQMSQGDYDALKADIAKHGVREPIWIYEDRILDGRHRHRACVELGVDCPTRVYAGDDAHGFVVSMNIHRRHLSIPQRRELIANLLKAAPEKSDRAIADTARADDKTVASVRRVLEANAEIPHNTDRRESSGRLARGRKPNGDAQQTHQRKPREQRVSEIAQLASEGHNPEQIAATIGIKNAQYVRDLIRAEGIAVAPYTMNKRGRRTRVDAARIIEETVNHLTGCVQGLKLFRAQELQMTQDRAADLWREAREAIKVINAALGKLREVANG